jgi:hypothetical protein
MFKSRGQISIYHNSSTFRLGEHVNSYQQQNFYDYVGPEHPYHSKQSGKLFSQHAFVASQKVQDRYILKAQREDFRDK